MKMGCMKRSNYNATVLQQYFLCNRCANNLISLKSNRLKSNAAQQVKTPDAIVKSVESSGKPTPTSSSDQQPTPKSKSPSSKSSKSKSGSRSNSRSSSANREIRIEVKPQGMGSKNLLKKNWCPKI